MDREGVLKIMTVLKAAYPNSYKGMGIRDAEAQISLWERMFAEDSYETVNAAVGALIATRKEGYTPTVGEVKEQIQKLTQTANGLSDIEAWALVSKACTNGIYKYREEYAKLPPPVQRAVGAPEQLREWAMMEQETVQSVVASNFMRSYRTQLMRDKELAMLPADVRGMIGGIADGMKMLNE